MVRRRSTLVRGSHYATGEDVQRRETMLNGIRASFVKPMERHELLEYLKGYDYESDDEVPSPGQMHRRHTIEYNVETAALFKKHKLYDAVREEVEELAEVPPSKFLVWRARFYLVIVAILFGTSFPLIKILDDNIPAGISTSLRFGMASIITLPWLIEKPSTDWRTSRIAIIKGLEIGLWSSLGFLSQAVGLTTTKANKSAFFCTLDVVVVPFLDRIEGKPMRFLQLCGAAMAVLGVGLLELDEGGSFDLTIGDLVSLIQPIAFGISYWRTEHVLEHYPEEANRITACELLSCFLFSFAFAIIVALANPEENAPTLGDWNEWLTSYQIWFALLWTGIMTTAVTLFLETIAMLSVGASETTLLISTEPLWAALFSWMILNESLGVLGIVGGLIIVGSCVLGMW